MIFGSCLAQNNSYFGETPPGATPKLFAPGIISLPNRYEFGCTLSKDGKEFYFGVANNGKSEMYQTKLENGVWSKAQNMFPQDSAGYNDPMLSPDEQRLYFISDLSTQEGGALKDIDIWYLQREGDSWSLPKNVGAPINNHVDQYFASFNHAGALYFASKDTGPNAPSYAFDIYSAEFTDGAFEDPVKLSSNINTDRYEADVFVAPDESYLIFCSIRKDGMGNGDLYISFKDDRNEWTVAKSMGPLINSEGHELCPYVTPDGKYFFYTSKEDIYWVSTEIFESMR